MAETTKLAPHIVVTPGVRGGRPYIEGKGVAVAHVAIVHEELGVPVPEIMEDYDLTPAEVHAALAYYHDHREEIDARQREDEAFIEEMKAREPSLLAEKLRSLRA